MSVLVESRRAVHLAGAAHLVEEDRELAWAEAHVRKSPDVKWILGNYVQASTPEQPTYNSNGHEFPFDDLKDSIKGIPHRPLNLLHAPNRRVGTFAAAEFVYPTGEGAAESATQAPIVEALAAYWAYYEPELLASIEIAHKEGHLFFCVDDETELLSADGWKRRSDLLVGEDILTLNTVTGLSEWTPLQKVNVYNLHGEEMVHMESKMHSSVTTPNHRWWVERRSHRTRGQGSTWEWRTTESLTQETWIPRAVPHAGFPVLPKFDDALVELAAWFWTEGTVSGRSSVIYQSHVKNPQNCDRIAGALTKLYGPPARVRDGGLWYATDHGRMRYFHLSTSATQPLLEVGGKCPTAALVRSLTESQLRLWVQTSLDGDGDNAASEQVGIKQNSLEAQRTFEMACALLGIPTNTRLCKDGQWRVGVIRRSTRFNPAREAQRLRRRNGSDGMIIERRGHHGVVWCPTTPNGTFLARRNGSVYWTGNSMEAVPKEVTCKGKGEHAGCGKTFAYDGRQSPTYCSHLNEVASRKTLHHPMFTAGALIIPPVKPGWKNADIKEISHLIEHSLAEAELAYDQIAAEFPHLSPPEWERMMAWFLAAIEQEEED